MQNVFQIYQSNKVGLNSKDSYVVTRGKTSFLRILGSEPHWQLMTATADEDNGRIKVSNELLRLTETALRLGIELETTPRVEKDWKNREYVKICGITLNPDQEKIDFNKKLFELFNKFFELYDKYQKIESRAGREMQELYGVLALDNQDDDVYLSDGVWLSSDGSIHDRGRQ